MKLCKDCKHFTEAMPQCAAAANMEPDYVFGKDTSKDAKFWSAQVLRSAYDKCGPQANWFEEV